MTVSEKSIVKRMQVKYIFCVLLVFSYLSRSSGMNSNQLVSQSPCIDVYDQVSEDYLKFQELMQQGVIDVIMKKKSLEQVRKEIDGNQKYVNRGFNSIFPVLYGCYGNRYAAYLVALISRKTSVYYSLTPLIHPGYREILQEHFKNNRNPIATLHEMFDTIVQKCARVGYVKGGDPYAMFAASGIIPLSSIDEKYRKSWSNKIQYLNVLSDAFTYEIQRDKAMEFYFKKIEEFQKKTPAFYCREIFCARVQNALMFIRDQQNTNEHLRKLDHWLSLDDIDHSALRKMLYMLTQKANLTDTLIQKYILTIDSYLSRGITPFYQQKLLSFACVYQNDFLYDICAERIAPSILHEAFCYSTQKDIDVNVIPCTIQDFIDMLTHRSDEAPEKGKEFIRRTIEVADDLSLKKILRTQWGKKYIRCADFDLLKHTAKFIVDKKTFSLYWPIACLLMEQEKICYSKADFGEQILRVLISQKEDMYQEVSYVLKNFEKELTKSQLLSLVQQALDQNVSPETCVYIIDQYIENNSQLFAYLFKSLNDTQKQKFQLLEESLAIRQITNNKRSKLY